MPKELNQDTIDALNEQGGADADTNIKDPDTGDTNKDGAAGDQSAMPDINFDDQNAENNKGEVDPDASKPAGVDNKTGEQDSDLNITLSKNLHDAGYSDEALAERITKDKGISDEFVTELKGKLDPDFVDAHVGRIRAELELKEIKATQDTAEAQKKNDALLKMNDYIFSTVGGKDNFEAMGKVLKNNISAEDLTALNVKLASGNVQIVNEAMKDAVSTYKKIRGMGGKLMEGDAGNSTDPVEHITKEEYRAIMRTDKYKTDRKYQTKIDADRLKTRTADAARYGKGQYFGYHPSKGRYAL